MRAAFPALSTKWLQQELCDTSCKETREASQEKDHTHQPEIDRRAVAPYVRGVSGPLARLLRPLGIGLVHKPRQWKWELCDGIKDKIPVNQQKGVVYSIPCSDCPKKYIGETLRTMEVRLKEHDKPKRMGKIENLQWLNMHASWSTPLLGKKQK